MRTFAPVMITLEELYALFLRHPQVCTDTRKLTPGCLFFALKGHSFDGNQFAAYALEHGAAYAVIDDAAVQTSERHLRVADVLTKLQQLATRYRRTFDIPIVAIGGSNGKTTTKELVSAVLSSRYACHSTQGNFNNHIGVPLTLLSMPRSTEIAVIEMGTNQPGDIALLCQIAEPTHGLLTNIGKEHLEGFGSLQGVKEAEAELYHYLARTRGCAFVNLSERYLKGLSKGVSCRIAYAESQEYHPGDKKIEVRLLGGSAFVQASFLSDEGDDVEVSTHLMGRHNFHNVMTAIALGIYFKVPAASIKASIEGYVPANNRSQLLHRGTNTILLDAYNANPSSMKPALDTLLHMDGQHRVAILGDMRELGQDSAKEHRAMLRYAASLGLDTLVLVGDEFGRTPYALYAALHFPDAAAAKVWYEAQPLEHTVVLLKGSRGMRLEKILE